MVYINFYFKELKMNDNIVKGVFDSPVIVVPILAPMITQTALVSDINPELTKPTTITVVADED